MGRLDFFFFVSPSLLSILTSLFLLSFSVSLSYFILAVPMRECLGKHSFMSSPFSIAILNATFFLAKRDDWNGWRIACQKLTNNNNNNNNNENNILSPIICILYFIVTILYCVYYIYFLLHLLRARLWNIAANACPILLHNVPTINYHYHCYV